MTEEEAIDMLRVVLEDAAECGIIDDYEQCPGVPVFDLWPVDGDTETSIQISVKV